MEGDTLIQDGIRALASLAPALIGLQQSPPIHGDIDRAVSRGYFKPEEDAQLRSWYAKYLTARGGLLETLGDLRPIAFPEEATTGGGGGEVVDERMQLKGFAVAYAATCLLVQSARFLVKEIATSKITQRKLNEPSSLYRIPRKQYTSIYKSLTDPLNAWRINEAMKFAENHRAALDGLADDSGLAPVIGYIKSAEDSLQVSVRYYLKARLRYRWHSWRRRRASAVQQGLFSMMEAGGRAVADVRYRGSGHRITQNIRDELEALLKPGDVFIIRHDHVLTNLFLPGYWPHAALHIGLSEHRMKLGITLDEERARRWTGPIQMLEAKKDGVRFRTLHETLTADSVAVIRPDLEDSQIAEALSRAVVHEGKSYNFDFDFFNDDKLVCTEVVYRAFDGVGAMDFELSSRAGKQTISAEDLLDMAVDGRGFTPLAVFGAPGCEAELVTGPQTAEILARTYRSE